MTFPARYGGRCAACDLSIFVDDPIRVTPAGVVHAGCVDDVTPRAPRIEHPVCSVCWLTHPEGACDR